MFLWKLKLNIPGRQLLWKVILFLTNPRDWHLNLKKIRDVPVAVNLIQTEICGIAGEEDKIAQLLQLLALQIITHHGYDDVRIVILAKEEGLDKWNF